MLITQDSHVNSHVHLPLACNDVMKYSHKARNIFSLARKKSSLEEISLVSQMIKEKHFSIEQLFFLFHCSCDCQSGNSSASNAILLLSGTDGTFLRPRKGEILIEELLTPTGNCA